MRTNIQIVMMILLSVILFIGCGIERNNNENEVNVTPIGELEQTNDFREGALAHILEGELNDQGKAVGFHYDQLPTKKGKVIEGTKTSTNDFGVFEAKVEINNVAKTSNEGKSTFFPEVWDTQQVVDAINEAYAVKQNTSGNTYEGLTSEGQLIRMYLDKNKRIISAFPVY